MEAWQPVVHPCSYQVGEESQRRKWHFFAGSEYWSDLAWMTVPRSLHRLHRTLSHPRLRPSLIRPRFLLRCLGTEVGMGGLIRGFELVQLAGAAGQLLVVDEMM